MNITTNVRDDIVNYMINFTDDKVLAEFLDCYKVYGKAVMNALHMCIFSQEIQRNNTVFLSFVLQPYKTEKVISTGVQILYNCGKLEIK